MHFLFPSDPINPRLPDDTFTDQITALAEKDFTTSLMTEEAIAGTKTLKGIPVGAIVLYRGWMLSADEYHALASAVSVAGGSTFITPQEYLAAHHLPNWYPLIEEFTPETRIYPAEADLVAELHSLGWDAFFIKDYVKSLKTSVGSLIRDPSLITAVVQEMKKFRGEIEGGICVRRVEEFLPGTERRYFCLNHRAYSPSLSGDIPEIVRVCAERMPSKFCSVDVARRSDGALRVVEIGDGQVSDLVGWQAQAFAEIWAREAGGQG